MKKYIKLTYVIITCAFVFVSCHQSDKTKNVLFEETKKLIGEKCTSINTYQIVSIDVIDSLLLIINNNGDHLFQVYNVNNDILISEFGKKGKGPGEFYEPILMNDPRRKDKYQLKIFDCARRRIVNVDLKQSVIKKETVFTENYLTNELHHISDIYCIHDSIFYFLGEKNKFSIYNAKNKTKIDVPYAIKDLDYNIPEKYEQIAYSSSKIVVDSTHDVIVTAPKCLAQLDFYNLKGEYVKTVKFADHVEFWNNELIGNKVDAKMYIYDIKTTDDFIYALSLNATTNQLTNQSKDISSELLVFNWAGEPIKKYIFDTCLGYFAIDHRNKCLYGYAPFEKDFAIIKYKL